MAADWGAAVDSALKNGGGIGIVRGYRRLSLELFPQDLAPPTRAYDAGLDYELQLITQAVNAPARDAKLVRRGLHITIAGGFSGHTLDRAVARDEIIGALASFSRAPVALPVTVAPPRVTIASLTAAQRRASMIVSAPVRVDRRRHESAHPALAPRDDPGPRHRSLLGTGGGQLFRSARAAGRPALRRTPASRW